jgi:hypothetical protein
MIKQIRAWMLVVPLVVAFGCGRGGDQTAEEEDPAVAGDYESPGATAGGHESPGAETRQPSAGTTLVVVSPGTTFTIALDQALSSKTNSTGDPVVAHVVGEIRSRDGELLVANGAAAHGVIAEVEGSGRVEGRAVLAMNITSIETVGGLEEVQTTMVEGKLRAQGTKKRDAATIVAGTAAGAVLGEILGDDAKLGAIIGAAGGTGVVLATKGEELNLEPGTQIDLKLVNPMTVTVGGGGPGT